MPVTRARGKVHQNNSASVNKLPNELLCEVFVHGLSSIDIGHERHRLVYLNNVTSICSLWRSIAIGTPHLWTTISFKSSERRAATRDKIETLLRRSVASPLYVRLHFASWGSSTRRMAELIMGHAIRFCELRISIWSKDATFALLPLRGPWPCLEALEIALEYSDPRVAPWEVGVGSEAPLRRLQMGGNLKLDNVPTCHLQDIDICTASISAEKLAEFISRCSSAKTVRLVASPFARSPLTVSPFDLPFLETLCILDVNPLSFPQLIRCANLRELVVQRATEAALWGTQSSTLSLWPHLRTLSLSECAFPPETIRPLLRAVPSLSLLFMSEYSDIITFSQALLVKTSSATEECTNSETLVPMLAELVILRSDTDEAQNGAFGETILEIMTCRPQLFVTVDARSWAGSEMAPEILQQEMAHRFIFRKGAVYSESSSSDGD